MEKFNKEDLQELFELAKGYEIIEEFISKYNKTNYRSKKSKRSYNKTSYKITKIGTKFIRDNVSPNPFLITLIVGIVVNT